MNAALTNESYRREILRSLWRVRRTLVKPVRVAWLAKAKELRGLVLVAE